MFEIIKTNNRKKSNQKKDSSGSIYRATITPSGEWMAVKKGIKYPMDIPHDIANEIQYIASTKANTEYAIGTIKKHETHRKNATFSEFWCVFVIGMTFKGTLVTEGDTQIVKPNWSSVESKLKELYEKQKRRINSDRKFT